MQSLLRLTAISVALLGLIAAAGAAGMAGMEGTWRWTDYTVRCVEGGPNGMSCTVIDGPKNKGMEMVQSKLVAKDSGFAGDIKHPASGDIYKAEINLKDADNWAIDGCTASGVCASGVFTRVK